MLARKIISMIGIGLLLAMVQPQKCFGDFTLHGNEQLEVNQYHNRGYLYDTSSAFIVSGGSVDGLWAYNSSSANISGGDVGWLGAWNSSSVNISGGGVCWLETSDSSFANISGGSWDGLLFTVYGLYAYNSSTVNISGGVVGGLGIVGTGLFAYNSSSVSVFGGEVYRLGAHDCSSVTFYGRNFGIGEGLILDGERVLGTGTLNGEWMNGTQWTTDIWKNDPTAVIRVVPAPAPPSLSGWNYRKEQTITGSTAGAQTNYQLKMTVHKGSGTDSNADVYCGGNCRDDFGDIRWTTSDGTTLMDYWIESVVSGDNAVFWIKVPSIPASPSTVGVYMYYGKSDATSVSNGANTFPLLFDDIEDGSISDWSTGFLEGTDVSTNQARGTYSIRIYDGTSMYGVETHKTFAARATGKAIVWIYPDNTGSDVYQAISLNELGAFWHTFLMYVYPDGSIMWYNGSAFQEFPTPTVLTTQAWSVLYFKWDCSANEIELFVNGTSKGKGGAYESYGTAISALEIGSGSMAGIGQAGYFDDFCIGEYVSPEPTWGTWGPAEGGGGPDITPPTSSVDAISPYWRNQLPFTISATATDDLSGVASVELFYRYSTNNVDWTAWTSFGVDTAAPWSWSFTAPDGDGYCEFYSIATDLAGNIEEPPSTGWQQMVVNGDFSTGDAAGWTFAVATGCGPSGTYSISNNTARIYRSGAGGCGKGSWLYQEPNLVVSNAAALTLSFKVKVDYQSLSGGGYADSEFPAYVQVAYIDGTGQERYFYRAFYYTGSSLNPNAEKISPSGWVSRSYGLASLSPKPVTITRVYIVSSGWDYDASFDDVSLTYATEIEADAKCGVDTCPPNSTIDPISPYWRTSVPFNVTATAADGARILSEDFSGEIIPNLEAQGWCTYRELPTWPVQPSFDVVGGVLSIANASGYWGGLLHPATWTDYKLTFRAKYSGHAIVLFRMQTAPTASLEGTGVFYGFRFNKDYSRIQYRGDAIQYAAGVSEGVWHDFQISAQGPVLEVSVDGIKTLSVADSRIAQGGIGFVESYGTLEVDDVKVAGAFRGSGVASVELFYRYSRDNSTWGAWTDFGSVASSPWSWSFTAPQGSGHYEFYSVATDTAGNVEEQPPVAEAVCGVVIDSDGDGVPDDRDVCPNTPPGSIVNFDGCSIAQLVPCAGPRSGGTWKNHGEYVRSVIRTATDFLRANLITPREWAEIVTRAARSKCGWRGHWDRDWDWDWNRHWDWDHDRDWHQKY